MRVFLLRKLIKVYIKESIVLEMGIIRRQQTSWARREKDRMRYPPLTKTWRSVVSLSMLTRRSPMLKERLI
jgi:hypothetical protein